MKNQGNLNRNSRSVIYWRLFLFLIVMFYSKNISAQCINTFPNTETFEASPVWTTGGSNSDWSWGTPSKPVITGAGAGSKCWVTAGLTGSVYNNSEQSYIVSPCYDFSSLTYPHVKFKIFWESEYKYDGGNLQYSINGGTTWINVGAFGDPVDCMTSNWYNYSTITYLNNPAWISTRHGWSGNIQASYPSGGTTCQGGNGSGAWVTAQHCLNGLAGQSNVIFRFTFGSGTTCNSYDGLAIDDFTIENGTPNNPNFNYACAGINTMAFTSITQVCPVTSSYAWNFGDPASGASNTSASAAPNHVFSAPGTYSVSLTTSGGPCNPSGTITKTVVIMSASISAQTPVSCFGGSTGSATVTATNGTAPYSYSWAPSGNTTSTASSLAAGNYTVTVTDNAGCLATSTVIITQPPVLTVSATSTDVNCSGGSDGTATATGNGGTLPYGYSWSSGAGTAVVNSLSAGTYTVTITDGNACTSTASAVVSQPPVLTATTTVTPVNCFGSNDGTASTNVAGGVGPYTYSWAPSGGNSSNANSLGAGTYTVSITDAHSCLVTSSALINQPAVLSASATSTDATCGNNNGTATAMVTGGTAPYSYLWSPSGETLATATGLASGNYFVTITDANSCSISASTLVGSSGNIISINFISTPTTCYGGNDGSILLTAGGGTSPYSYNWSPSGGSASSASSLVAGNYSVTVTDSIGCSASASIEVMQPAQITVNTSGQQVCNGQAVSLTATAAGGTAPYSYSWDSGTYSGSPYVFTPASSVVSTVVATDANGCSSLPDTAHVTLLPPLSVVTGAGQVICPGASASLSASASGGNGNYNFVWTPGNIPGNSITVSPSVSTTYTVTLTDGCTLTPATDTEHVEVVPLPQVSFNGDNLSGCSPVCVNFTNSSGVAPGTVNWEWSFGDGNSSNLPNPSHCYSGTGLFSVSLTASSPGCSSTYSLADYIEVFPKPIPVFTPDPQETDILNSGITFINNSINGNSYIWSFGDSTTSTLISPTHIYENTGTYPVWLVSTTNHGCTDSVMHEVTVNDIYTFYAPNAFTPGDNGLNEVFLPVGEGWDKNGFDLWIFDRWGNMCYHTKDIYKGWDGRVKNGSEVAQIDVYVWKVSLKEISGRKHQYTGTVTIVK